MMSKMEYADMLFSYELRVTGIRDTAPAYKGAKVSILPGAAAGVWQVEGKR